MDTKLRIAFLLFVVWIIMSFSGNDKVKVKLFTHIDYMVKTDSNNIIHSIFWFKEIKKYDEKGNTVEDGVNYLQSFKDKKVTYLYDAKGKIIELLEYGPNGKRYAHGINKYDDKGNRVEQSVTNEPSGKTYRNTFKYDDNGNMIEEDLYQADGNLKNILKCQYDNKDRVIWQNIHSDDGHAQSFKYDDKGNQIESDDLTPDGILITKHIYVYDDKGKKIESDTYKPDASLVVKYAYVYDDKENIIVQTKISHDGSVDKTINKFTYDTVGNWTIDSTFENDTLTYIRTQEFEYY